MHPQAKYLVALPADFALWKCHSCSSRGYSMSRDRLWFAASISVGLLRSCDRESVLLALKAL